MNRLSETTVYSLTHCSLTPIFRSKLFLVIPLTSAQSFRGKEIVVLSWFGRGDTWICGSFITDTYDKIAKFISTHNAMYGMFKL